MGTVYKKYDLLANLFSFVNRNGSRYLLKGHLQETFSTLVYFFSSRKSFSLVL
jgi:hypothetical protein